jgi:hypothetical protein
MRFECAEDPSYLYEAEVRDVIDADTLKRPFRKSRAAMYGTAHAVSADTRHP